MKCAHLRLFHGVTSSLAFLALVTPAYLGVTAPLVPVTQLTESEIDRPARAGGAGALPYFDTLLSINGQPLAGCMYWLGSPYYGAPRDVPIPLTYSRLTASGLRVNGVTTIVLHSLTPSQIGKRLLGYISALAFVVAGAVILLGGQPDLTHSWLGHAALLSGLVIAAGPDISDFHAPLSVFFWWGVPLWAVCLSVAHALWPVNQIRHPVVASVVAVLGLNAAIAIAASALGADWNGCHASPLVFRFLWAAHSSALLAPLPVLLCLLIRAYLKTTNPFTRLQVQTIGWAAGLGFSTPVILSLLPNALGVKWVAPVESTLLVTGIIPVTYLCVIYRGELLTISRYLNRIVFTAVFFLGWTVLTLVMVNILDYWFASLPPHVGRGGSLTPDVVSGYPWPPPPQLVSRLSRLWRIL